MKPIKSSPSTVIKFHFDEVIVPAHTGVIDSEETRKPLHMLPVGGKKDWSVQFDELPKLILKMELSDGTIGISEFYRDHNWRLIEEVANGLLGQDITTMCLQDLPVPLSREYDGFECAIWDAYAKQLGIPLYMLLGGAVRDRVYVGAWSSHRTIAESGQIAKGYAEQGYDCIKFKCDLEDDVVAWCEEIKQHAPGMKVIFDPNQRWENAGEARRLLKGLEKVGNVLLIEDPIRKWMLRDYAELRRASSIPIVQHISLPYVYQGQRVHDAINVIEHGSVDGYNFNAGLAKFKQLDAIASAANMNCWHGSEVDLGILEAMYLHQSLAAKSCVWPGDIFGRMIRSHDLLKKPIRFEPPYAFAPNDGPGLGIELDEDAIAKYRISTKTFS
ncbi:mandelate racemase/muconate lactonizing enzyme family protein [Paremcibacter congregatus]|uniref:mandelate racemase/muconate lactonizing enzyme family protein n=1 Tax=Paremcibacter congregatus TaxID=2043170 RepID=UPI003A8F4450